MATNLEIVKFIGDEKVSDLNNAVAEIMSDKINQLVNARKEALSAQLLSKEGYEGNTPDEKALIAKLLKNISKHDYPVKNDDDLPFKALKTHPTGPAGDHAPADPMKVP